MTEEQNRPPPPPPRNLPKKKRKKRRAKQRLQQRNKVTCLVCHQTFSALGPEHLQTHNMSVARYRRLYLTGVHPPALVDPALPPPAVVSRELASHLVSEPQFIATLADEVSEAIFSGPLRDRLKLSLVSLLSSRMQSHGEASALLQKVRQELSAPWRLTQGGELGAATDTRELINMAMQMHTEVSRAEETLLKTIKLAIDESKGRDKLDAARGGLAPYTGDAEIIPIPADLSAEERETVRSLLSALTQGARLLTEPQTPISADTIEGTLAAPASANGNGTAANDTDADHLQSGPSEQGLDAVSVGGLQGNGTGAQLQDDADDADGIDITAML